MPARHCIMCYIHPACPAAKPRRVHSCRRKRRSANSVTASQQRSCFAVLQRRSAKSLTASQQRHSVAASLLCRMQCCSVAARTVSQRRSRVGPASQRCSVNSVAASIPRRSVAAPTAHRSAAPASQRRSVNSAAASLAQRQRRSVAASQRRPPPGAS